MKAKNKKKKIFNHIKFTLLAGLCAFLVIALTMFLATCLHFFLKKIGIITYSNFKLLWLLDYAFACMILGSILTTIIVNMPAKHTQTLLDAMERIANGDYTARVTTKSKLKSIKKTVEMFNHMATQLSSTEMMSYDFINNFSHEFKTPIASINGFAKILKDSDLSEKEKEEYLNIIIRESERLSNLSVNILTLSKLEKQAIVSNKTVYNLNEQLRIIIGSLYKLWADKNIEVELLGKDCFVTANKELLGQVWINLLDNAIKFSPEDKKITVNVISDGENVIVNISNYGKTVSEEQADRIFDKFFQGDPSHSTNGNGLGLPLVKRIIELHSGEISIDLSKPDMTVFNVTLPEDISSD